MYRLWVALAPVLLLASSPAPAPRLVTINVIARNPDGSPLTGLKKEDFQVFDNGQPRQIREFFPRNRAPLPAAEPLPEDSFSNVPAEGTPSSVTIVLLDDMNDAAGLQSDARPRGMGMLRELQPGDGVAIYYLGDGLHVLGSYQPKPPAAHLVAGCEWCRWGFIPFDDMRRMDSEFYDDEAIKATFRAVAYIANNLAALPGRKNLVWMSSAFPEHPGFAQRTWAENLLASLNNVDVAVYPVPRKALPSNVDGLRKLADLTGGRAFLNPADLETAMHTAVQDSASTYTLAFYAPRQKPGNAMHSLKVTLAGHPSAALHYRTGYLDVQTDNPKLSAAALADAVWSPLEANGIGLRAEITQTGAALDLNLYIDPGAQGKLDLVLVQLDARGKQTAGLADTSPPLPLYQHKLTLSPKSVALRMIVRDPATGAMGSVTVPLAPLSAAFTR